MIDRICNLGSALVAPFVVPAGPTRFARVVESARVLFALLLMHQAIDVLGFVTLLEPNAGAYHAAAVRALVAATLLLFGAATPLACGYLVYHFGTGGYTGGSLGDMVSTITAWAMLLFGAGRHFSLDALLVGRSGRLERWWFALAVDPNCPRSVGWVRFAVVCLYWAVCVAAMGFHFNDPFWLSGEVLPVSMAGPYFSYHHRPVARLLELFPTLFPLFCAAGLFVQVAWEVLLLPCMYFRAGRHFVVWQGVAFFAVSLVCLNLQYLPHVELVLWWLVFGLGIAPAPKAAVAPSPVPVRSAAFAGVGVFVLAVSLLHTAICPYELANKVAPKMSDEYAALKPMFSLLGLKPVCVFNREDMDVNIAWLVLSEIDEGGNFVRLVPFMDSEGGRLRYMRNDLLYFVVSLRWHRIPIKGRFDDGDSAKPYPYTVDFAGRVARLDAQLNPSGRARRYRVDVFRREMIEDARPPRWTAPSHEHTWTFAVAPEDLPKKRRPTYDLPPGHWSDAGNARRTVEWLRAHPLPARAVVSRQPVFAK